MNIKVKYILNVETPSMRIMGYRPNTEEPWHLEVTLKRIRGICFYTCEDGSNLPSLERLRTLALRTGVRSPRPFVLGSARDHSVRRCAIALTHDLFLKRAKDPKKIFDEAHRSGAVEFSYADMQIIIQQASWEGLMLPLQWGDEQIKELIRTLGACGEAAVTELIWRHAW